MNADVIEYIRANPEVWQQVLQDADSTPAAVSSFKKLYPDAPVAELFSLAINARRAARRITGAEQLLFTDKASQQASSSVVAAWHARRFSSYSIVADLCCGAGVDLWHLAAGKTKVWAVDSDPVVLAMARYNSGQHHLNNIEFSCSTAEEFTGDVQAVFIDPDRRTKGRRELNAQEYSPSLSYCLKLAGRYRNVAIKLSPAWDWSGFAGSTSVGLEFVSERGDMKEILLTTGDLNRGHVAVMLPNEEEYAAQPQPGPVTPNLLAWLYEPDAAIIRAGLTGNLANDTGLKQLEPGGALLTGDKLVSGFLGQSFRVLAELPYHPKQIQQLINAEMVGILEIKTRGMDTPVEQLRRQFKLKGQQARVLFVMRQGKSIRAVWAIRP